MTDAAGLTQHLTSLVLGRCAAAEDLVAAARRAGAPAMLAVGSMASRTPDPFSDVDLLLIHDGPDFTLDVKTLACRPVLATVNLPRPHPAGIGLSAIGVGAGPAITWLNLFHWPAATALIPADSLILYDTLGLPYSPARFQEPVNLYGPRLADAATPDGALRQIAAHAKLLARAMTAPADQQAEYSGPSTVAAGLRRRLTTIEATRGGEAVARTAALIDLADTVRTSRWLDGRQPFPPVLMSQPSPTTGTDCVPGDGTSLPVHAVQRHRRHRATRVREHQPPRPENHDLDGGHLHPLSVGPHPSDRSLWEANQ